MNRDLPFVLLGKIGCPIKFKNVIKMFYTKVKASLVVDGDLTQFFEY